MYGKNNFFYISQINFIFYIQLKNEGHENYVIFFGYMYSLNWDSLKEKKSFDKAVNQIPNLPLEMAILLLLSEY